MAQKDIEHAVAWVALLRGVNVGGKNLVPMKDLARMFEDAGCTHVRTYIQSGNVVFRAAPRVVETLADRIGEAIATKFGFRVPVILRDTAQMKKTVENNPFLKPGVDEAGLHVYFLAAVPPAEQVAALDSYRSPPDAFAVHGCDVYLHMPNGMGRTKLTNLYFDKKLGTVATARNWRTTVKLLEMMRDN